MTPDPIMRCLPITTLICPCSVSCVELYPETTIWTTLGETRCTRASTESFNSCNASGTRADCRVCASARDPKNMAATITDSRIQAPRRTCWLPTRFGIFMAFIFMKIRRYFGVLGCDYFSDSPGATEISDSSRVRQGDRTLFSPGAKFEPCSRGTNLREVDIFNALARRIRWRRKAP